MNYFNKKQIAQLKPYETHFKTIIDAKYKRATLTRVNELVANIYEETTNEVVDRNWTCGHCIYKLFEKCGKLYYESIKKLNEKNEKSNNTGDKKCDRKSTSKTTKPGRSKQNNN